MQILLWTDWGHSILTWLSISWPIWAAWVRIAGRDQTFASQWWVFLFVLWLMEEVLSFESEIFNWIFPQLSLTLTTQQWRITSRERAGKFIPTLSIASTIAWKTWTKSLRTLASRSSVIVRIHSTRQRSKFYISWLALEGPDGSGCRWVLA